MARTRVSRLLAAVTLAVAIGFGSPAAAEKPPKQEVLHKGKTICVSPNAAANHVAQHGDTILGAC